MTDVAEKILCHADGRRDGPMVINKAGVFTELPGRRVAGTVTIERWSLTTMIGGLAFPKSPLGCTHYMRGPFTCMAGMRVAPARSGWPEMELCKGLQPTKDANAWKIHHRRQGCVMLDRDRMIAQLLQMAIDLGWTPPGDVIDQINAGGLLVTTQATDACEVAKTTIHRWMEEAAAKGRPLGVLSPAGYLIGRDRLLDFVEAEQGLHERVKVKACAEKYANVWSQQQPSLKKTVAS